LELEKRLESVQNDAFRNDQAMTTVALVSGDFLPTGGMDMPNLALASYLARQGHEVEVVAHRIEPALSRLPGVYFHRVPKPLDSYFLGSPLLDRAGRQVGERVLRGGGRVVVNGGNCQVGDVNWVHYVHAAFKVPLPPVGIQLPKHLVERQLGLRSERRALTSAKLVLANSELTRRHLVERMGVASDRVRVVYSGIDGERFRPMEGAQRDEVRRELELGAGPALVFVGALGDSRKGFDTLFDAWGVLARRGFDGTLLVIGRGASLESWKARAAGSGWSDSLRFLGFRTDVPRILAAADCMVAPPRYEAFGQAVQEALCCGIPAVVSGHAGVAERLSADLRDLVLQEPESAAELAAKIAKWRDGMADYATRARALSISLRERTWDVMAAEIADLMGC
jgi:glycosyltransferase involved in cell wall biosynthesis